MNNICKAVGGNENETFSALVKGRAVSVVSVVLSIAKVWTEDL